MITQTTEQYWMSSQTFQYKRSSSESNRTTPLDTVGPSFIADQPVFSDQLEKEASQSGLTDLSSQSTSSLLWEQLNTIRDEMYEQVKQGGYEPSFLIGGSEFTEKTWNQMLKYFDLMQAYLTGKELPEDNSVIPKEDPASGLSDSHQQMDYAMMLCTQIVECSYHYEGADGTTQDLYLVSYSVTGIFCMRAMTGETEWQIPFDEEEQYENGKELYDKIANFMQRMNTEDNLTFACHEEFWRDFLADRVDMEEFEQFLYERVHYGIPDILEYTDGHTASLHPLAEKYMKYFNQPHWAEQISPEELLQLQEEADRFF